MYSLKSLWIPDTARVIYLWPSVYGQILLWWSRTALSARLSWWRMLSYWFPSPRGSRQSTWQLLPGQYCMMRQRRYTIKFRYARWASYHIFLQHNILNYFSLYLTIILILFRSQSGQWENLVWTNGRRYPALYTDTLLPVAATVAKTVALVLVSVMDPLRHLACCLSSCNGNSPLPLSPVSASAPCSSTTKRISRTKACEPCHRLENLLYDVLHNRIN